MSALYSIFRRFFERKCLILYRTPTLCATDDVRYKIWAFQFNFASIKTHKYYDSFVCINMLPSKFSKK